MVSNETHQQDMIFLFSQLCTFVIFVCFLKSIFPILFFYSKRKRRECIFQEAKNVWVARRGAWPHHQDLWEHCNAEDIVHLKHTENSELDTFVRTMDIETKTYTLVVTYTWGILIQS